ncbi:uncharacterized protein M6B38_267850 [Iris pallida]|uniref:Enhancer of polycomb-like protein n=1 Tax=Iris pallida TaxID=29817 RepID=A0AAX6GTX8_IRIPA|nr:uncharacterized protein M6B38_344790 [Iris pallida]KAJ6849610.1 uncharacterized protein M6B38_267850 [Iris pallida]
MRKHARSEGTQKTLRRRDFESSSAAAAGAAIGSRVIPFRTPPPSAAPASMPTAGARRPTRVFVRSGGDAEPARTLRSGRQVSAPRPRSGWMKVLDGDGSWWKGEWSKPVEVKEEEKEKEKKERMFDIVYSRKRRRSASSSSTTKESSDGRDRRFGIVFSRKHQRKGKKLSPLAGENRIEEEEEEVSSSSKSSGSLHLAVVVESSCGCSSVQFAQILVSIMSWVTRVRVRFRDLSAFLSSGAIASVFSTNGIHFSTVEDAKSDTLAGSSSSGCGFCKIYGARSFTPLVSLNFAAIPNFFNDLHSARILASFHLSATLFREQIMGLQGNVFDHIPHKDSDSSVPSEAGVTETEFLVSETPAVRNNELSIVIGIPAMFPQSSVTANNSYGFKFRKHQKKRSAFRNSRTRQTSRVNSQFGSFSSYQNSVHVSSASKLDFRLDPVCVKPHDSCLPDLFDGREESDAASSPGSNSKQRSLVGNKSPIEKIKELRSALAEVRQNIDSARCKANILVTVTDRCWREDEAEVMMEMSDSQEWVIAVKRLGSSKYLHKPEDLKPCVVNRFTHAYMWSGDEGWKLEFCDKWDWYVFKELHMECRERNIQEVPVKIIPVPGVREVSGYEDDAAPSFIRPDMYIHTVDDEVGRALTSGVAQYDMDSADEEWLRQLNSSSYISEEEGEVGPSCMSEENFEKIIFTLERDAYNCVDDPSSKERALDLCQGLGKRDMVSVVYDYWLKKRKQKRASLVRVFQGLPLMRAQLLHKPFLKKKRSFKRQRSQVERSQAGRGKPVFFLQAENESQKVQEAENAAKRAAEVAIQLRARAQMLIANADLAVYRCTMALRIAETIPASSSDESPDIGPKILCD